MTTADKPTTAPESLAPAAIDVQRAVREPDAFDDTRWTAEAFARRARLTKYVGAAVAACALIALVGGGLRYAQRGEAQSVAVLTPNAVAAAVQPIVPAPPPPDPETAQAPSPSPEGEGIDVPAEPTPPPPIEDPAAAAPSTTDRDLARIAKKYSHRALETGHVVESIVAGERAVELDPTDREAWLILGAAYQQRGAHDQARRCFQACIKAGTRGETWQCSAMLR